jgi:glyoxylase-like metal-dependent hydrolase (beta-lactamase superfamily II)
MSEPLEIAERLEKVAHGLFYWRIHNSAIGGGISSSHALTTSAGSVFVDPVRLANDALTSLPRPDAILLTARCHQRSAWRYRAEFGAEVWLPEDAEAADEEPDHRYAEGDALPGGLVPLRTPGPERPHYSFFLEREPGVLFCSDLLMRVDAAAGEGGGRLAFVPPEYHEDPAETRRSVERLLDLPFSILCLDHGAPISDDPKAALRRLLGSTA